MFSHDQIQAFIELYEKEFGLRISQKQAEVYATQLINFLRAIYQDIKENEPPP